MLHIFYDVTQISNGQISDLLLHFTPAEAHRSADYRGNTLLCTSTGKGKGTYSSLSLLRYCWDKKKVS